MSAEDWPGEDGALFSQKWMDHIAWLEKETRMAAAFEAKEPVAAEHALQLTLSMLKDPQPINPDADAITPDMVVKTYGIIYRGILKALKEGIPS